MELTVRPELSPTERAHQLLQLHCTREQWVEYQQDGTITEGEFRVYGRSSQYQASGLLYGGQLHCLDGMNPWVASTLRGFRIPIQATGRDGNVPNADTMLLLLLLVRCCRPQVLGWMHDWSVRLFDRIRDPSLNAYVLRP